MTIDRNTQIDARSEAGDTSQTIAAVNGDQNEQLDMSTQSLEKRSQWWSKRTKLLTGAAALLVLVLAIVFWPRARHVSELDPSDVGTSSGEGPANEVKLSPEALEAAKIEVEGVTQRPAVALLRVTGTVESNPQQTQQVTPLVSGRVERVNVALGDRVQAGTVLAVISSPEIAEMHGKLREAMTRLDSAEKNLARVQRAENRAAVLQSKAKLDEAEATLKRTRRLIELGAGAGKDLIAAETAYTQAKAEYEFQRNISFNREVQEAQAEVNTSRAEVTHLQQSLRALGVMETEGVRERHKENISLVIVQAPAAGIVTERTVNPGAGVEAGKALFTISNISTMWVIANVPEAQLGNVQEGTPAEIRSAALGASTINGRVAYIDPQLSEETRTGRVRIEVPNPGERLKAGMFVEVGFQSSTEAEGGEDLMIPSSAVQRVRGRTIVFVPKANEAGVFEVREVQAGGETQGYTRIVNGLRTGELVVTSGSFSLKTQLEKASMADAD